MTAYMTRASNEYRKNALATGVWSKVGKEYVRGTGEIVGKHKSVWLVVAENVTFGSLVYAMQHVDAKHRVILSNGRIFDARQTSDGVQDVIGIGGSDEMTEDEWQEYCLILANRNRDRMALKAKRKREANQAFRKEVL